MRNATWKRALKFLALLAAAVVLGACSGTPQARNITVTFVRNAQSQANADGVLVTDVPGPSLTDDGKGQAQQLVRQLPHNEVDAIYSSPMAEAQQTAAPLASELGKQVEIIQGLQPISAGRCVGGLRVQRKEPRLLFGRQSENPIETIQQGIQVLPHELIDPIALRQ